MAAGCKLEEALLERGLLTREQLEEAAQIAKSNEERIERVLVQNGYIPKSALMDFMSSYCDIPFVDLTIDLVDPDAVRLIPVSVARSYAAVPVTVVANILTIAISNPFDLSSIDMLAFASGFSLEPILAEEDKIFEIIDFFFAEGAIERKVSDWAEEALEFVDRYREESPEEAIEEGPVVKLVNVLVSRAIKERASDIHIEPEERITRVRYRVDGVLIEASVLPSNVHNAMISRLKVLSQLDIAERRMPQDGRFFVKYMGRDIDFRIAFAPTIYGELATIRILDQSNANVGLEQLGLEKSNLSKIEEALRMPYGFVLITGPTGSGKTTTQYAMINSINDISKKIITIEDPVEYRLDIINQIPVNYRLGLDFARVLRSVLRLDPDIIMLGEIRDFETASIAVEASMTGHMLISTMHTNNATETLMRLLEIGIEPYYVREVVTLIISQRLIRRLCEECRRPTHLSDEMRIRFPEIDATGKTIHEAVGCSRCSGSGYVGRTGIFEVLRVTERIKDLVARGASHSEIRSAAISEGMVTMWDCGIGKIVSGVTSPDEVLRVASQERRTDTGS